MKDLIEELKTKAKGWLSTLLNSSLIILGIGCSFTIGYYYNTLKELATKSKPIYIKRSEVIVGIDEHSSLIIIKKSDGSYTTLQDSVSKSITDIYTKNNQKPDGN